MEKSISVIFLLLALLTASCSNNDEPKGSTVLKIGLNKENTTLEIGKAERLIATFTPEDAANTAHTWRSSNPSVVSVDETGLIKALSEGSSVITATALANNSTATCKVTVVKEIIYPQSITLNSNSETLTIGNTFTLIATIKPANASDNSVTWKSSDPDIASVSQDGIVKALSEGTAKITATTFNNKTATCQITATTSKAEISKPSINVLDDTSVDIKFTVSSYGVKVTQIGVCYSTETTPTLESEKRELPLNNNASYILDKLKPNTQYFIRAYANTDNGVFYSPTTQFTTQGSIYTDFVLTDVYKDKLYFETPTIPRTNLLICYGIAPKPEITDYTTTSSGVRDDKTIVILNGLSSGIQYYLRAYKNKNNKITYYEKEGSGMTLGRIYSIIYTDIKKTSYRRYCTISYRLPEGTYKVTGGSFSKTTPTSPNNAETLIYVPGGAGSFYLWSMANASETFEEITFTHMTTGVKYHSTKP